MTEEQLLFAAFFHDLGKLLSRAGDVSLDPDFTELDLYGHAKFSAQFIRTVRKSGAYNGYDLRGSYLLEMCTEEVERAVLYHHNPKGWEEELIQLADWIQSAERVEKEEKPREHYQEENLLSPVAWVDEQSQRQFFSLVPLTAESIIPRPKEEVKRGKDAYRKLYREFLQRLRWVKNFEQLLNLSEIYLSSVPAQTGIYEGDISLFDHARLVAGLTQVLYRNFREGILVSKDLELLRIILEEKDYSSDLMQKKLFFLLKVDLSGIQRFIFSVPSDRALRMIKGRSVYLDLLVRYVVKHLLENLGLSPACVLYVGGGNAEVLLPWGKEEALRAIRQKVSNILLDFHQGELYCVMEWIPLALGDLFQFIQARSRLEEQVEIRKRKRFLELGEETFFHRFFLPQESLSGGEKMCPNCGREKKPALDLCPACESFVEFTDKLKKASYLFEETVAPSNFSPQTVWEVFGSLGFRVSFHPEVISSGASSSGKWYRLEKISLDCENRDYLADGFLLGSFRLPEVTFDEIFKTSMRDETGDPSLGYLKMDVDNLGATFAKLAEKGKERATALSLYRAFSRRLELFFGGYLVDFLAERIEEKLVYPVFSGGDDLFLIGGWREISQLAWEIRQKFNQFSGFSSLLTLSGGIAFLSPKMPVVRASRLVEEVLERAKSFHYTEDTENHLYLRKDKLGIFEEILNWMEYQEALDLYQELERRIRSSDSNRAVPRAIFRKIEQSLAGFTVILNDSLQGKIRFPRIWKFLYFLRDHKEVAERIEKILLGNVLKNKNIRNPRLVLVANRLAAMATRKYEKR